MTNKQGYNKVGISKFRRCRSIKYPQFRERSGVISRGSNGVYDSVKLTIIKRANRARATR